MKVLKYRRGQVWWYQNGSNYDGAIQGKTRPVIIISNDLANAHSKVLIGVPLTTQEKKLMPTHVVINLFGKTSTVLAENMMSLNVDRLTGYIGCLDEELLIKVEDCCKTALGFVSPDNFRDKINNVVDEIVDDICEDVCEDDGVYKLTSLGKEVLEYGNTQLEYSNSRGRKPKYTTDEARIQFIKDYESNGMQYMIDNYKEPSASAVYAKVYKFRKRLGLKK